MVYACVRAFASGRPITTVSPLHVVSRRESWLEGMYVRMYGTSDGMRNGNGSGESLYDSGEGMWQTVR